MDYTFELRWKVETWLEYRDDLDTPITHTEKPVLQYRTGETRWVDVPVFYFEE